MSCIASLFALPVRAMMGTLGQFLRRMFNSAYLELKSGTRALDGQQKRQ